MFFESNLVFHIYNQGNNREQIFFRDRNYLLFLQKMRNHILPYVDILCYCLMPNHFHWLVYVKHCGLYYSKKESGLFFVEQPSKSMNEGRLLSETGYSPGDCESPGEYPVSDNSTRIDDSNWKFRTFNDSIAILLRSYTRAINRQENRTGSLFREDTKAKSGWIDEFITVDRYRTGKNDFRAFPDDEYGWHCFNYIHDNPVKADLCLRPEEWEYSSAKDFAGLRNGTLCNQTLARQLLCLP